MKRKTINRPHWKQIAKRAKRKLAEAREKLREKQPQSAFQVEKFDKAAEIRLTKAQQKWYQQGTMDEHRLSQEREERLNRKLQDFQDSASKRHQRCELLKPALELINKLMED